MIYKITTTKNLYRLLMTLNTGLVFYGIKTFLIDFQYIHEDSMFPLLRKGDIVMVKKSPHFDSLLHKVTFTLDARSQKVELKRILGVSHDWMEAKPYMLSVPQGHVWAEADWDYMKAKNQFSQHSYLTQAVMVQSEVLAVIFPLNRAGWLSQLDDVNYYAFSTKRIEQA